MKKHNKYIIFLVISFFFLITSGMSTWIIYQNNDAVPEYNPVSALTNYLKSATTKQYIYDPETNENFADGNKETANSSLTYTAIHSDLTYNNNNKTIYLGDPKNVVTLNTDVTFTHKNSVVDYTESNYLNSTNFTPSNGSTDAWYTYKNSSLTTVTNSKYNKWINYYYQPHTDTFNNYIEKGVYEKESFTIPSQRLFTIKLAGDVVISSTLSIGSLISSNSNGYAGGIIEGNFVVLDLNGHTITINSGATLNAYGYILDSKLDDEGKHVGKIINNGTIYSPFVVENYSGGGNTVATGAYGTAPFTLFSIPYLSCKVEFNYGSSLKCPSSLYANDSFSKIVVNMIGTSSTSPLIEMTEGSKVIKDSYNNPDELNSSTLYAKNYKTYLNLSGNINVKTLKITLTVLKQKTINMAEFGMTIPPYIHINIESGKVSLGMRLDFLPGSTLTVQENATIDFTTLSLPKDETIAGSQITTDGGIRMLSQMTSDTSLCYKGTSYGIAVTSGYVDYLKNEALINQSGNTEARANIYGNITVSNTNNTHPMVGKINLHNNSLSQVVSNSNISTYSSSYEYYAYISGEDLGKAALSAWGNPDASDIQGYSSNQTCGSYISLPLVSNGKVVNPSLISSTLGNNTTYDYTYGVFYSNSKTYALMPNNENERDLNCSLREVTFDQATHSIIYNGNYYAYYRNTFVKTQGSNDNKVYVKDDKYSGFSTQIYYDINFTSNTVNYTIQYNGTGTTDTAEFTTTRTRSNPILGSPGEWSVSETDWETGNNLSWEGPKNITEGTEVKTTTNYILNSVNVSNILFSSTYQNNSSFSHIINISNTKRPAICGKFSQSTTSVKYIQIGTLNLSFQISASEEVTEWIKNMSTATEKSSTSGIINRKETATKTVTATRNHNTVSEQNWSLSNQKMYAQVNSTSITWNDTIKQWVRA
ncbi:MAG: hypothetical protein IJD46_02830 [Bacilli bacterium]|nr:hypothetical protein [Bacilli bacterium]